MSPFRAISNKCLINLRTKQYISWHIPEDSHMWIEDIHDTFRLSPRGWMRRKLKPIYVTINSLRPRQNGRLFADDAFERIFLNENIRILIKNSLKFVPKGLINNITALVLIMAWRRPGDKPLSEPMMISLLTHICVTRPQWVKTRIKWAYLTHFEQTCYLILHHIWRLIKTFGTRFTSMD